MRLIGFAIYVGMGAMLHALFVGAQFDWTSAWTFGWLFGWPIMLIVVGWAVILTALAIGAVCWVIWSWFEMIATWRDRRKHRKARG